MMLKSICPCQVTLLTENNLLIKHSCCCMLSAIVMIDTCHVDKSKKMLPIQDVSIIIFAVSVFNMMSSNHLCALQKA